MFSDGDEIFTDILVIFYNHVIDFFDNIFVFAVGVSSARTHNIYVCYVVCMRQTNKTAILSTK